MKKALVFEGQIVQIEAASFPVAPALIWVDVADDASMETHVFDGVAVVMKPPPPPPTLAQSKAAIDKQRDAALDAGIAHNGHLYHSDPTFQSQLQAFMLAWVTGILTPTATVTIRRKDNVTVQMARGEVGALAAALMTQVQGIYVASWEAKEAL